MPLTAFRATLIRDVPYTMLELGLYENFKTLIKKYRKREVSIQQMRCPWLGPLSVCAHGSSLTANAISGAYDLRRAGGGSSDRRLGGLVDQSSRSGQDATDDWGEAGGKGGVGGLSGIGLGLGLW